MRIVVLSIPHVSNDTVTIERTAVICKTTEEYEHIMRQVDEQRLTATVFEVSKTIGG